MCIAAWTWQAHPAYGLLLLFNRDEFHSRPTRPAQWWAAAGEGEEILGGMDELGGGTWLGCTKGGKLAFLTNVREPSPRVGARSRGELPVRFLQHAIVVSNVILAYDADSTSSFKFKIGGLPLLNDLFNLQVTSPFDFPYIWEGRQGPLEYATEIAKEADQYNGFNLVLADVRSGTMVYISNKPGDAPVVQTVSPGCHVLSNAAIDSPWPKVLRLGQSFNGFLAAHDDAEVSLKQMVEELMTDTVKADRSVVPDTGVDPDWEYELSSIFIDTKKGQARYGTRSMAAIGVKLDGEVTFYEKSLASSLWNENVVQFEMEMAQ
ncbi:hypothetical protein TRIUR3_29162 [Triticum urartu]|uniref:Ser/Thr-rich protein T10 in DGCR region n=1 Tax=Triticum urartu TaxID=4572 RepID=M7YDN7_TRIUA|nr:hypothetical protein TRIUR3_29162 [Triticum urartu]